MRKHGRRDGNHKAIADTFRALGCSVAEFPATDIPGWPDLCVGCIGVNHIIDAKNPETAYGRSGLNANQMAFNEAWRGEKIQAVSTPDEVIALVRKWRCGTP